MDTPVQPVPSGAQPPVSGQGLTLPVPPVGEAKAVEAPPVSDELAALNPLNVLSKKPEGEEVSSYAPQPLMPPKGMNQFILPTDRSMAAGQPIPPPVTAPTSPLAAVPTSSLLDEPLPDPKVAPTTFAPPTVPTPPQPVQPSPPISPSPLVKPTPPIPPAGVPPTIPLSSLQAPASHSRVGIIAGIGVLIALMLLSGGGFVLASNGLRLPLFYRWVSGLNGDGVVLSKNTASLIAGRESYQQSGDILIQLKTGSDAAPPSLPATGVLDTTIKPVSSLEAISTSAQPLAFHMKDSYFNGSFSLKADGRADVPVFTSKMGSSATPWYFSLANTTPSAVSVSADSLHQTLLYPFFRPVSLPAFLRAVQKETGYERVVFNGQNSAHYHYQLDSTAFADFLPSGASLSAASGELIYAWKTSEPLQSVLTALIHYNGQNYTLKETFNYQNWNKELTATDPSGQSGSSDLSVSDFVSNLGFAGIAAVPNSLPAELLHPAIVPSGEAVSTPMLPITVIPPVPASTADAGAAQRDTKRLSDLADLQKALEGYKNKQGSYPVSTGVEQTGSSQLLFASLIPTYLTKMPVDPLKNTYWYEYASPTGQSYHLRSVAEDSTNPKAIHGTSYYYFEVDSLK